MNNDDRNMQLGTTADRVDELNAKFYGKFPFPWRPMKFEYLADEDYQTEMLNQNLGSWEHEMVPRRAKIWVAGCGTNQAVITALNYPKARVIGSDLSAESLELGASTARELGITNLELRRESINHAPYKDQFDFVICTGVIHHNANPGETLKKLEEALKPTGILELMVYNRYERLPTTAFQKAIRLLGGDGAEAVDFERDLARAKQIIKDVKLANFDNLNKEHIDDYPDCLLADLLILPAENSYTVESLSELASACNLEIVAPCYDMFDKDIENNSWNMKFTDRELQRCYESLPDLQRWQVTNHLQFGASPQLWFYMQRRDSGRRRKEEREVCEEFLDRRFKACNTQQGSFIRGSDGKYRKSGREIAYPVATPAEKIRKVIEMTDGSRTMREVFEELGMETTFQNVNAVRLQLSTSAFPHLKSVERERAGVKEEAERSRMAEAKFKRFKAIKPSVVSITQGD